ncbi:MAG: hypothetical protein KGJ58_03230 [Patescibacteria group bacterium]|nr:hypothetical protein [Patescibacteria group bacterium]MDE1988111.1 hypothetical protein [Patescibacteria group bacterium]MDE2218436.1 hypothetical protein [Patescibacteria group bacterium]
MLKKPIIIFSLAALAFTAMALPKFASAHEEQVIRIGDKDYLFVIGSLNEPVIVDDKTGIDLRVFLSDPSNPSDPKAPFAKPATGLDKTIKAEISAGDKKQVFDLAPAYANPGAYIAVFFPTVKAALAYRLFGTIDNVPVDLNFVCDPAGHTHNEEVEDKSIVRISDKVTRKMKAGAFGCPLEKADLGFPEKSSSLYDIRQKTSELNYFAILSLIVGLIGAIAGIGAWMKSKKRI